MTRESFRYFTILDGASLTNEDESGDPAYYGYTRPGISGSGQDNSTFIILEIDTTVADDVTYRFFMGRGNSNFDTNWTNRTGLTYKKAGEFKTL